MLYPGLIIIVRMSEEEFTKKVGAQGRITIPKPIRTIFGIKYHSTVTCEIVSVNGVAIVKQFTNRVAASNRITIPIANRTTAGITCETKVTLKIIEVINNN